MHTLGRVRMAWLISSHFSYLFENIEIGVLEQNWLKINLLALREKCPYSEFFWSVVSHIGTEYGEVGVSLRLQSEYGEIETRKTPKRTLFRQCW